MQKKVNDGKSRAYHEGKKWFEDGYPFNWNPYSSVTDPNYKEWELGFNEAMKASTEKRETKNG